MIFNNRRCSMMTRVVLFTALISQILFAQQTMLSVDQQPVAESEINWETTLTLSVQNNMENGFLIEIPAEIKMVPLSARINQNDMLLQNTQEAPSSESVVCWDLSPEGINLFFQDGQLNTGDQIVVKTMTTQIKKARQPESVVNIRSLQKKDSGIQYSEDIKSSANLLLKIENKRMMER